MSFVIRAAARTLPAAIRDRYREQWLADARDATEAGLRPASIELAALAFAVTYDRPLPSRPVPTAQQQARRSRLALGLAFSAALLALSQYPRIGFVGLTGLVVWDYATFFLTMLLFAYAVLAPVTALVLVRGRRQRWAVVLLAIATTAPVLAVLAQSDDVYLSGLPVFAVAAVLIGAACALLWRPNGRSLRAPLIGGLTVMALTAIGLVYGVQLWSAPIVPSFGIENAALYEEWVVGELQFKARVLQVLWVWAIAGAVLGSLVFLIGRMMTERRAAAFSIATVAISLLAASAVFGLLELGADVVPDVLLDPLRLIAQVVLVAVTLVSVGGIRLTRVRHRHDVEGAVELL